MNLATRRTALFAALWTGALLGCIPATAQPAGPRPYVVLVSLDGFRYDYAERYHAKNLLAIRDAGASASALIPVFPTVTFPNHLSIITGLYPEHHGIVMNRFYDSKRGEEYSNKKTAPDGTWYSGKPLWVLAGEQGVKSASMFWPGSDAEIEGRRPTYWFPYDGKVSNEERVARVLAWLKLPEAERPHFMTLYLSDADTAGHDFGPESPETRDTVEKLDLLVGELRKGIQETRLPVNLIIVSDHGMQAVSGAVDLNAYADLSKVRVINEGPFALLYARDRQTAEDTYRALKGKDSRFEVYRRAESPLRWHYRDNPRAGDTIVIATKPIALITKKPPEEPDKIDKGRHGYDPGSFETMRGIFYAIGPNIRAHAPLTPFENVNIYPFIAEILGLQAPAGLDGSLKVLQPVLMH